MKDEVKRIQVLELDRRLIITFFKPESLARIAIYGPQIDQSDGENRVCHIIKLRFRSRVRTSSQCDNFCNFLVHSWLCRKVSLLRTLFLLYLLDVLNLCLNRLEDFAFKTELRVRPNKDKDIAVVKFWTTLKPTGRKFPLCKVHLNLSTQGINRTVSFMYHFVLVPISWNNLYKILPLCAKHIFWNKQKSAVIMELSFQWAFFKIP